MNDLSNLVTSNSVLITKESKFGKNGNVIAPGMFRINLFKTSREDKFVAISQAKASVRTNPITVSQPHVITKKHVNSDSNGLSLQEYTTLLRPEGHSLGAIQRIIEFLLRLKVVASRIKKLKSSKFVYGAIDSLCSKHMTGNLKLLINFVWKFLRTVRFGNDHVAAILGYDDYSHYMWVHFLRSKDKAPKEIKTFLKKIIVLLQAPVIIVRTDNGIEFKNQDLKEYFDSVGISHQASSNDLEDFGKLGAKCDIGFFLGYFGTSCAYRVYNRRTKKIMETMNVTFDELSAMAFEQRSDRFQ
ncbi:retrovirus-related pol polyprotein from transposon TNT 1-94 [Tanacetum coccineum]